MAAERLAGSVHEKSRSECFRIIFHVFGEKRAVVVVGDEANLLALAFLGKAFVAAPQGDLADFFFGKFP